MVESGVFVTLFDDDTLRLYLSRGIYAFHMPPVDGPIATRSRHYSALADYGCVRDGTHVFFFLKRKIVYGGQVVGSKEFGAFYLNGPHSPLGKVSSAPLVWDESGREKYKAGTKAGCFTRPRIPGRAEGEVCQPYLIMFDDRDGLRGKAISSDALYFELGEFAYPLPSNSIAGMSFCTLSPAEVRIALRLLRENPASAVDLSSTERVELQGKPTAFNPTFGISTMTEATSESQLEASVTANPALLPVAARLERSSVTRQIPISPFKPSQMDRADVCYFGENEVAGGSIPNLILELKMGRAGIGAMRQVERYLDWLHKRLRGEDFAKIQLCLLAESFARGIDASARWPEKVRLLPYGDSA